MSLGRETIYVGVRYTNEDETLEDVVRQYSPTDDVGGGLIMTTTYHIILNDQSIDQDTSMGALLVRLKALAEANPNNHYSIAIEGPGNPVPPETT